MLECNELQKIYDDGFSLRVKDFSCLPGECIAVLGVNGAGKSTFFELLSANLEPTSGNVFLKKKLFRLEEYELKRQIGYLPQKPHLPMWASCQELLQYCASLYGNIESTRISERITYWDCLSFHKIATSNCSHGMQKRTGLAVATLHDPELLILDEPFSGLDITHTKALEKEIINRSNRGKTTILSTHVLPYVVRLCSRVYIINNGELTELKNWNKKEDELEDIFFKKK